MLSPCALLQTQKNQWKQGSFDDVEQKGTLTSFGDPFYIVDNDVIQMSFVKADSDIIWMSFLSGQ